MKTIILKRNDIEMFNTTAAEVKRIQYVWWFGRWIVLTLNDGKRKTYNRKYYDILMIIE